MDTTLLVDHKQKFLRQMLYNDYYRIEKPTNPIHIGKLRDWLRNRSRTDADIDHCIDNLRQNLSTYFMYQHYQKDSDTDCE